MKLVLDSKLRRVHRIGDGNDSGAGIIKKSSFLVNLCKKLLTIVYLLYIL